MHTGKLSALILVLTFMLQSLAMQAQENNSTEIRHNRMFIRIAEIEIYPPYLTEYLAILKEEAAASVKLEPGVISIFPLFIKKRLHTNQNSGNLCRQ